MSNEDIVLLNGRYEMTDRIGPRGVFGRVYKAKDRSTQQQVAVKVIQQDGVSATTLREVALWQKVPKHVNLANMLDHFMAGAPAHCHLVFEIAEGNLVDVIQKHPYGLSPEDTMLYTYQLLNGVAHLHHHGIYHRDLKPDNILVNATTKRLQVTDIGLSRDTPVLSHLPLTPVVIAGSYRPPEIILGCQHYDQSIDLWSCGVIAYQMRTRHRPFRGDVEIAILYSIFTVLGTPTEDTWPGVSSLPYFQREFPIFKPSGSMPPPEKEETAPFSNDEQEIWQAMIKYPPRSSAASLLFHPYFARMDKMPFHTLP